MNESGLVSEVDVVTAEPVFKDLEKSSLLVDGSTFAVAGGEAQETVSDRGVEDISSGDVETIEESSDVSVTAMEDLRDGGVLKERAESAVARASKRRLTAREDVENVDERRFFTDAVSLDL